MREKQTAYSVDMYKTDCSGILSARFSNRRTEFGSFSASGPDFDLMGAPGLVTIIMLSATRANTLATSLSSSPLASFEMVEEN